MKRIVTFITFFFLLLLVGTFTTISNAGCSGTGTYTYTKYACKYNSTFGTYYCTSESVPSTGACSYNSIGNCEATVNINSWTCQPTSNGCIMDNGFTTTNNGCYTTGSTPTPTPGASGECVGNNWCTSTAECNGYGYGGFSTSWCSTGYCCQGPGTGGGGGAPPPQYSCTGWDANWVDPAGGQCGACKKPGEVRNAGCDRCCNTLTFDPGSGQCLCPTGGATPTPPPPPTAERWFQITGGPAVANNGGIRSNISQYSSEPYFIMKRDGYSGIASYTKGSSANFGKGSVSQQGWIIQDDPTDFDSTYNLSETTHSVYDKLYAQVTYDTPAQSFLTDTKPGVSGVYLYGSGSITNLNIQNRWAVASNEKYIVFVPGNLTINAPINVHPDGFLTFIVKGNITVGGSVSIAPTLASTYQTGSVGGPPGGPPAGGPGGSPPPGPGGSPPPPPPPGGGPTPTSSPVPTVPGVPSPPGIPPRLPQVMTPSGSHTIGLIPQLFTHLVRWIGNLDTVYAQIRFPPPPSGFPSAPPQPSSPPPGGGTPPANSSTLRGLFIADGTFDTGSSGRQLVVEGIIIANKVELSRSLTPEESAYYPSEIFVSSPALWIHMPPELLKAKRIWHEIAP